MSHRQHPSRRDGLFIGWRPQMIFRPGGAEGSADRATSFVHDSGTTFRPAGAGLLGSGVPINMASLRDGRGRGDSFKT